ncbi:MAG: TraR/DksA family transcriptional regulator [Deltaproteobacteria bacterium]|nr:TraR/DksA family transcriptional regulator [Deltaproteobacteria bacterium]
MNERNTRLRNLLMDQKRRMWGTLRGELFNKLGKDYNAQFANPQDVEDLALIDIIEDTGIALADMKRKELEELEAALKRLEGGVYGVCTECGSGIDEARLKVMPFAGCCVRCQCDGEGKGRKPTL